MLKYINKCYHPALLIQGAFYIPVIDFVLGTKLFIQYSQKFISVPKRMHQCKPCQLSDLPLLSHINFEVNLSKVPYKRLQAKQGDHLDRTPNKYSLKHSHLSKFVKIFLESSKECPQVLYGFSYLISNGLAHSAIVKYIHSFIGN